MTRISSGSRLRLRVVAFVEAAPGDVSSASELFAALELAGGEPIQLVQTLVVAAFDSAARALAFATSLPSNVRAGLSVGDVLFEGGALHGLPVIEASRLRERAQIGRVLCNARLAHLAPECAGGFAPAERVALAGFVDAIEIYERVRAIGCGRAGAPLAPAVR